MGWHLAPGRSFESPWLIQVAVQRAPESVVVSWLPAKRVTAVRDPGPGSPRRGVRHVWVRRESAHTNLPPCAGLLVQWRRSPQGWQALVAAVQGDGVLLSWVPADRLIPIRDDGWETPEVVKYKRG